MRARAGRSLLSLLLCAALLSGCNGEDGGGGSDTAGQAGDAGSTSDAAASTDGGGGGGGDAGGGGGTVLPAEWIRIKAGSFTMGSPTSELCRDSDETPHRVTLTRDFEIGKTEVTRAQFKALRGYDPSYHRQCGDDCPVEQVSWHEATAYCAALSRAKGLPACARCSGSGDKTRCTLEVGSPYACKGYRLPTEAEWEYAARAGTTSAFYVGAITSCMTTDTNAGRLGWYKVNSGGSTHPVGRKAANPWKLADMGGNVYEWTSDVYQANLGAAAVTDPVGPASGAERVFRGGAWYFNAEHARSANRERFRPEKRFTFVGFRCVRSVR